MKIIKLAGATTQLVDILIQDSTSTTGAGKTGLLYNTGGLTAYYHRSAGAASAAITLATMTLGTWATGGFKEVDAVNMPGVYQLGIPDAALAAGATDVALVLRGAAGMVDVRIEVQLVAVDLDNATSLGLTRLDAAVSSRMATFALPTNFSSLAIDASGRTDLGKWIGTAPNALVNGRIDAYPTVVQSGTAQAGAATSITLAAGASATDSLYVGELVSIASGTGAGQIRVISAYVGATKVATVAQAWTTIPDVTSVYAVLGIGRDLVDANLDKTSYQLAVDQAVNVTKFGGTAVTGRDLGASVLIAPGTGTGQLDVTAGVLKANLVQILGTALTETAGQLAAAFKQFFNVSLPTGTVNSLPNAAPGASGGVFIAGSNAATTGIAGDVQTGLTNQGYTAARAPYLDTLNRLIAHSGTAQAGAATSLTLAAGASATDSLYVGETVLIYGGTGAGQIRAITGYVGATKVATITPAWAINPDATSTYLVLALGRVTADVVNDKAAYALSQAFPANFSSLAIDASGRIDLGKWIGAAPNALQAGRVDGYLGAVATGVIAAASFAANALDAVWSTATRTLTAFAFNVTVGDIVSAALAKFFSTSSGTTYAAAVSGSVVKEIVSNTAGGSSPATIAAAVWDEPNANHLTAGSTGAKLNGLSAGAISVVSPVLTNGRITLVKGDDYKNADGRALFAATTFSSAPSLTGGTVALKIKVGTSITSKTGTVTGAAACYVEMTTTDTTALTVGDYAFDLEATLSNGDIVTLVQGTLSLITDVR